MIKKGYRIVQRMLGCKWKTLAPDVEVIGPYRECSVQFDTSEIADKWAALINRTRKR